MRDHDEVFFGNGTRVVVIDDDDREALDGAPEGLQVGAYNGSDDDPADRINMRGL